MWVHFDDANNTRRSVAVRVPRWLAYSPGIDAVLRYQCDYELSALHKSVPDAWVEPVTIRSWHIDPCDATVQF